MYRIRWQSTGRWNAWQNRGVENSFVLRLSPRARVIGANWVAFVQDGKRLDVDILEPVDVEPSEAVEVEMAVFSPGDEIPEGWGLVCKVPDVGCLYIFTSDKRWAD